MLPLSSPAGPIREFHVSRKSRNYYQFDQQLFSFNGNVIFANFFAARIFAQKINDKRDTLNFPERAVRAGHINAMGLIDELQHIIVEKYRKEVAPDVMERAIKHLEETIGGQQLLTALQMFCDEFPPVSVYQKEQNIEEYLTGATNQQSQKAVTIEEIVMLWLANANPALTEFTELFDDTRLSKQTVYPRIISELHNFFARQPGFGPENENLIDLLRKPALIAPHSIFAQLEYMREHWATYIGQYLYRLLSSLDFLQEEDKPVFTGPGPSVIYDYNALGLEKEEERFSPDSEWMPRLTLLAKNAYVWLDQLTKQYQKKISTLDQIPNEELEKIAGWGFKGLWLIGLWERSPASQQIKHLCGNPDAVASAYSLYDYQIAADLGGDAAYENLRARAAKTGIRLAADMVPNHTGIYSKWVIEHPDWFVSLPNSPFPAYTFNGPDLSTDPSVGLYLEDHYYQRTDAAVVFKRVGHASGDTCYIYHGNDGTSMPWNDTAQLNFLNPETREAVIQTIFHVARKFSVIRFDAAMTLAKKHIQRLWFPEPGSGGAIPSRAEHSMTREQFNQAIPVEFWREVVDRVAQEVPDTLLLAEAFWLMEGYFVRTLGMHRVYNSAFMNMLRDEKNAEYRLVIKNTLEFDPQILKRYVNFMNNPDEKTAIEQFGSGGKYFGVCVLLCTLPGLPMFGHGQVEGFHEKYGMEYYRAYWDENPNEELIKRHEHEIFPLLHKRFLFADVENFLLYDLYSPEGYVNEDVFAYSNNHNGQRSLVIYHNKWSDAKGWLRESCAYAEKIGDGETKNFVRRTLGEGLELPSDINTYVIYKDAITGHEHIHNCKKIHEEGLFVSIGAYQYQVCLDFRVIQDNEWQQYKHLTDYLKGFGVPDINLALKEIFLQPILTPYQELVNAGMLDWMIAHADWYQSDRPDQEMLEDLTTMHNEIIEQTSQKLENLFQAFCRFDECDYEYQADLLLILKHVKQILILKKTVVNLALEQASEKFVMDLIQAVLSTDKTAWGTLLIWYFTFPLGRIGTFEDYQTLTRSWLEERLLNKYIKSSLSTLSDDQNRANPGEGIVKFLTGLQPWPEHTDNNDVLRPHKTLTQWLKNQDCREFVGVNRYQGILWYDKGKFKLFIRWMLLIGVLDLLLTETNPVLINQQLTKMRNWYKTIVEADEVSGYKLEALLAACLD